MEKRLPLALVLSLLFLWWYVNMTAPPPEEPGMETRPSVSSAPAGTPGGETRTLPPGVSGEPGGMGEAADPGEPVAPGTPVLFSGKGFVAEFDTRGAALSWLELSEYHTEPGSEVDLRLIGGPHDPVGSLLLRDFARRYVLDNVIWDVEPGHDAAGFRQLAFSLASDDGLVFRRTVTETDHPYLFTLEVSVENTGNAAPDGTLMLVLSGAHGVVDQQQGSMIYGGPQALALVGEADGGDDIVKWSGSDLATGTPRKLAEGERLICAGSMSNYFAALVVPGPETFVAQVQPMPAVDGVKLDREITARLGEDAAPEDVESLARMLAPEFQENAGVEMLLVSTPPAPGERTDWRFSVYAGPKDRVLAEQSDFAPWLGPVLDDSFGSMAFINHALLAILRFFEWLTSNWGVAIILLTLVVRALLFPLNRVQQSSMQKYSATMQRLKPEIDALKAKHKNNTRKFNEEQMKLLRSHGATPPLGGCLLMFLQFPIWISLFQILRTAIELRHAPFVFWVKDLSRADQMPLGFSVMGLDTLNLLPILMAAAMIVQMRFQAKTTDPSQAQMQRTMAMIMPVMMLFFLYQYPSGLSLYILTSSLLGIFEYQMIRRFWPPPTAAVQVIAPAGKPGGGRKKPGRARA
ncbi:MAG: YidC/Oxa1 family insertase periplasmic-domain containing protein [Planctomycetota bacterium]|jgi:YidC/Oxa1 family membrane protein insertase